ncbi:MAG: aminopeptidase [Thermoanaerobaculia bacterium]
MGDYWISDRRPRLSGGPFGLRARALSLLLAGAAATSCSGLGFYGQAVWGGLKVLTGRRSVTAVLEDDSTPCDLKQRLATALAIRDFASARLGLPDNGSYRKYKRLRRPYAVWNVVAAPELSVEPVVWCFPIAGCVTYRGYFAERRAERFAAKLQARGYDVDVAGAAAFSTLGWFKDPLLSTFIHYPEPELAGLILHELAHQRLYLKDDTPFNESFATVVEREGVGRWLGERGEEEAIAAYRAAGRRQLEVAALVSDYRELLAASYAEERPQEWKRRRKQEIFAALRRDYLRLKASWGEDSGYDAWFAQGLNNARLASIGAYFEWVPAFEALLDLQGGDLERFYGEAERIGRLPPAERKEALSELVPEGGSAPVWLINGRSLTKLQWNTFQGIIGV